MDILSALSNLIVPEAKASEGESYYNAGQAQTKQNEGFRPTPYVDTKGVPTIGYGFNMNAHPDLPHQMDTQKAGTYFNNYYKDADSLAMRFAGDKWGGLTDAQKIILSDMAYNLKNKLLKFHNMRADIQSGNDQGVRNEMVDSNWYSQVGDRGQRNVNNWTIRNS